MFRGSKNYKRRYNSIVGIDKVSDDTVEANGIDSYKPSKSNFISDTLIGSVDEDEYFNSKVENNYEEDMDLLEFKDNKDNTANRILYGVEEEVESTSKGKNTSLVILVGLCLGVVVTLIVNILM